MRWIFRKVGEEKNEGYIEYRHVICQALHHLSKKRDEGDGIDPKKEFDKFYNNFNDEKMHSTKVFMELYFFSSDKDEDEWSAIIIDRTKGIYPLILDNFNMRLIAFKSALENIKNRYGDIMEKIKCNENWCKELQEELSVLYDGK